MRTLTVEEVSAVDGGNRIVNFFVDYAATKVMDGFVGQVGSNPNWAGIPSISESGAMP